MGRGSLRRRTKKGDVDRAPEPNYMSYRMPEGYQDSVSHLPGMIREMSERSKFSALVIMSLGLGHLWGWGDVFPTL